MVALPFNQTLTELQQLTPSDQKIDIVAGNSGVSPVAAGSTLTFQYPPSRGPASYAGQKYAWLSVRAMQGLYIEELDFSIAYNADSIVVTYAASTTIPANVPVTLQLPVKDTSGALQSVELSSSTATPATPTPDSSTQGL